MKQYYVMVRTKDESGAGVMKAFVMAENSYQALQMAKAMYGRLLLSESAVSV